MLILVQKKGSGNVKRALKADYNWKIANKNLLKLNKWLLKQLTYKRVDFCKNAPHQVQTVWQQGRQEEC